MHDEASETSPGILSGVCRKCCRQTDVELIAQMRRNLYGEAEWFPIEEEGSA
jgi:hypothetical protein